MATINYKKMTSEQLVQNLGVVMEQIQATKRGLKEHPEDIIFTAAVDFMRLEAESIMKEFTFRADPKNIYKNINTILFL